jgi:phosphoribosyl-AMP cyclohydrolase / phosphoribosyl-ATP pyrophosphohydrolase
LQTERGACEMDIGIRKSEIALEAVRYDAASGLVPVVVQSVRTGAVLMVAYANREALKRTLGTGEAWFWSRSRQDYWRKGATSGNTQKVDEVRIDCDGDSVLYLVEERGPACHTGEMSCFYRTVRHDDPTGKVNHEGESLPEKNGSDVSLSRVQEQSDSGWRLSEALSGDSGSRDDGEPGREPGRGAGCESGREPDCEPDRELGRESDRNPDWNVLTRLWQLVVSRDIERPNGSYTTYLFEHGVDKVAKKVGEEAAEVVIAAKNATVNPGTGRVELAKESADLVFHLLALWRISGIAPDDVLAVLHERGE